MVIFKLLKILFLKIIWEIHKAEKKYRYSLNIKTKWFKYKNIVKMTIRFKPLKKDKNCKNNYFKKLYSIKIFRNNKLEFTGTRR